MKGTGNKVEEVLFDWFVKCPDPQDSKRQEKILEASLASDAVTEVLYWLDRHQTKGPRLIFRVTASDQYSDDIKAVTKNFVKYGGGIKHKLHGIVCEKHMPRSAFSICRSLQAVTNPSGADVIILVKKSADKEICTISIAAHGSDGDKRYVENLFDQCTHGRAA